MNEQSKVTSTPASTATVKVVATVPTPPLQQRYRLVKPVMVPTAYVRSAQRTIVWNILYANFKRRPEGMTIDEIAPLAAAAGLVAVGGVGPSVRYHLHYIKKDGWAFVTNPNSKVELVQPEPLPAEPEAEGFMLTDEEKAAAETKAE